MRAGEIYVRGAADDKGQVFMHIKAVEAGIGGNLETARTVSTYFTHHGLTTCTEASPHCAVCPLAVDCEWLRHQ